MTVASLELCKELYEVSGWGDTEKVWCSYIGRGKTAIDVKPWVRSVVISRSDDVPAYELSYLVKRMPTTDKKRIHSRFTLSRLLGGKATEWGAFWESDSGEYYTKEADTPEDAACKLAIELFKQNILVKA